jgi:hypothetical protein
MKERRKTKKSLRFGCLFVCSLLCFDGVDGGGEWGRWASIGGSMVRGREDEGKTKQMK